MDRFADPTDRSFVGFVSHPVGESGESVSEDFGGLLERLCLFDYQAFMPNPVCRGLEFMLTPSQDYYPNIDARFLFLVLLSMEKSVQDLIEEDLRLHGRETKVAFYREEYLHFVKQTINRLFESNFNEENVVDLLEMTVTKLQAVWLREDMAEILSARKNWNEIDRAESHSVKRTKAERSSEKKRTNNKRNQERIDFTRRLMSGEPDYWKKSNK